MGYSLKSKNDIANFVKKIDFDNELISFDKNLPQIKQEI